jgi:hypothetical protein
MPFPGTLSTITVTGSYIAQAGLFLSPRFLVFSLHVS